MKFFHEFAEQFKIGTTSPRSESKPARRARWDGDYNRALSLLEESFQQASKADDKAQIALIMVEQAELLILQGEFQQAVLILQRTLETERAADRKAGISAVLNAYGLHAQAQNDWDRAREYFEQARAAAQQGKLPAAEARAMGGLADTYLHEANASYALYLLREALPQLLELGEMEWAAYYTGRMGEAQISSGREAEGQELLTRALRLAESYRITSMLRLWSLRLGERALNEGRYTDSRMHFMTAIPLFKANHSTDQALALSGLSTALLKLGEREESLRKAEESLNLAHTLGHQQTLIHAQRAYGAALRAIGRSAAAVPHLAEAAQSAVGSTQCDLLRSLAAAQAAVADEEAALKSYEQAVICARRLSEPLELAITLRDQGILYERLNRTTEAISAWVEAVSIYEQHGYAAQVVRLYCDLAQARRKLADNARAMKDFEQALMGLSAVDDAGTRGLVLANAAIAYSEYDVPSAESFFQQSIALAVNIGDTAAESLRRGNYGYFLLNTSRPKQAVAVLEQAQRFSQSQGHTRNAAIQTSNLGLAYGAMGNYSVALQFHQQAFDMIGQIKDLYWETAIQVNLASALAALNRPDAALPLLEEALDVAQTGSFTEPLIRVSIALASLYLHTASADTALDAANRAVELAHKYDYRRLYAEALGVRSEIHGQMGKSAESARDWDDALRLFTVLQHPQAQFKPPWLRPADNAQPDKT